MWAASTPIPSRKRKLNVLDDLALSPIKNDVKRRAIVRPPPLPSGTAVEPIQALRPSRPLSDICGITNLPPLSALPRRLTRFSTTKANLGKEDVRPPSLLPCEEPIPKLRSSVAHRASALRPSSSGLNSIISKAARNSRRNRSVYPDLIVISDSEDESQIAETVHSRTRRSTAIRRASQVQKPTKPRPANSDVPGVAEFTVPSDRVIEASGARKSAPTIHLLAERSLRLTAIREDRRQSVLVQKNEYLRLNEYAFEAPAEEATRCVDPEETLAPSCPKITKFTLSDVESWKEIKDQPGSFFSRGLPALAAGVNGEPFPARCGYLKMSVKTKFDIASSPHNVVFTVIKGKGHMKDKTNGAAEKTDMNIGDTFVVPRGSAFTLINQATKNEFVLSYVKHN